MNLLLLLQSVLLTGGTVHPMTPGAEPLAADVLVVDGRIEAIGPDLEAPEDAEVIDAAGRHLVPGLIDGMIHHDLEHDPLYVHAGITLARDMGNDLGRIFMTRRANVRDAVPGPDLYICGAVLDGMPPVTTEAVVLRSAEEADHKIPRLLTLDHGEDEEADPDPSVDFLAFHLGLPAEAWRRLVELGHEHGLGVWGPVPRDVTLEEVLAARQHGLLYIESFLPRDEEGRTRAWERLEPADFEPTIEAAVRSGLAVTPLLSAYAQRIQDPGDEPEVLLRLSPQYAKVWRLELEQRRPHLDEDYLATGRMVMERQQSLLLALHEAGVPLVPGSGAPNPWLAPGEGLHAELALWEAAGIPPLEVLRHATAGAARVLGVDAERGTLEPGRIADLLVLEQDPATGVEALRAASHVLLRGRVLEREELDELVELLVEAQTNIRLRDEQPLEVPPPALPEGAQILAGYVETSAYGQRFSGERYAVVREADGTLAYVSLVVTPGGVGSPPTVLHMIQRIRDEETSGGVVRPTLVMFDLAIETGGNRVQVEGARVGGNFNVRRRVNGMQVDNNSTSRRPILVDAGSATAAMILAQHVKEGPFEVVYFEDLEPSLGQWAMEVRDGGILAVATLEGPLVATFALHGGLDKLERVQGSGRIRMESLEARTFGGPGLPLPPDRVAPQAGRPERSAPPAEPSPSEGESDPEEDAPEEDSPVVDDSGQDGSARS